MDPKAEFGPSLPSAEVQSTSLADLPAKNDCLGFEPYVQALRRFLLNEQTHGPLTISIEGEWGIGKSSFMKQLSEALNTPVNGEAGNRTIIVWFNAWRHDRAEALWASFALEFIRQVTKQLTLWQRLKGHGKLFYRRFKWGKGWPDIARALIWIAIGFFLLSAAFEGWAWINGQAAKWFAGVAIASGAIGAVTKAFTWTAEKLGNPLKIDLKQHSKSPDYEQRTAFLEEFHQDFAKILKAYVSGRRVFVFVDDLDRCEIPKAAELLQALNLMLASENDLYFLLGMDRQKVAAGIALKHSQLLPYLRAAEPTHQEYGDLEWYGLRFGYEFIEKFIQIPFVIPSPTEDSMGNYIRSLSKAGVQSVRPVVPPAVEEIRDRFRLNVTSQDSKEVLQIVERVAPALANNPRRVKLFLNLFRLRLLTAVETGLLDEGGALTFQEKMLMHLPDAGLPPQNAITLEELGTFVALGLRWPLFLLAAVRDPLLIARLEDRHESVTGRWSDPQLREFLTKNQKGRLGDVDIRRLLKALPQVRTVGRTLEVELHASTPPQGSMQNVISRERPQPEPNVAPESASELEVFPERPKRPVPKNKK